MDNDKHSNVTDATRSKRPYQRPRIAESGRFEDLVLACGHRAGGAKSCNPTFGGTINS